MSMNTSTTVDRVKRIQQEWLNGQWTGYEYLDLLLDVPLSQVDSVVGVLTSETIELLLDLLSIWPSTDEEWAAWKPMLTGSCVPEMLAQGIEFQPKRSPQEHRRIVEAYRAVLRRGS